MAVKATKEQMLSVLEQAKKLITKYEKVTPKLLDDIVKDIGFDNPEAIEAAKKYVMHLLKGSSIVEGDTETILGSFYDGYQMAKGISYLPKS